MKKALKVLLLLCALLCLMIFATGCLSAISGISDIEKENKAPTLEEAFKIADESLDSPTYRVDMALDFTTDDFWLGNSCEMWSDMEFYEIRDGENFHTYMSVDSRWLTSTMAITVLDNTYYTYTSNHQGNGTVREMCKITDEQLAALEKKNAKEAIEQSSLYLSIELKDFENAHITEENGKYIVTLNSAKEETLDSINDLVNAFISTDEMDYDDFGCVFTISDDKLESLIITADYSVERTRYKETEVNDFLAKISYTFDHTIEGVTPPKDLRFYNEVYFEYLYGETTADEYEDSEDGDYVVINTYIQGKEAWREVDGVGVASFYTQYDYGCFLHNVEMTKEEYDKLKVGDNVMVYGHKVTVDGQPTVADAKIRLVSRAYRTYEPIDVSDLVGSEQIVKRRDIKVCFDDVIIVAANDEGAAFLYGPDGTGKHGDDIYFKAAVNIGKKSIVYTFVINAELVGSESDEYQLAEQLEVGTVLDLEGFLNWSGDEPLPHIYKFR
ncbi:MAG: hypothetical protein IJ459_00755 [Clostridia bacterium]|nr:hypothetical protein [Clostridia bacterium]